MVVELLALSALAVAQVRAEHPWFNIGMHRVSDTADRSLLISDPQPGRAGVTTVYRLDLMPSPLVSNGHVFDAVGQKVEVDCRARTLGASHILLMMSGDDPFQSPRPFEIVSDSGPLEVSMAAPAAETWPAVVVEAACDPETFRKPEPASSWGIALGSARIAWALDGAIGQ